MIRLHSMIITELATAAAAWDLTGQGGSSEAAMHAGRLPE